MISKNFESSGAIDRDWLALRYVGDEMSADERAEFEALLADDQAARESVAAAVEIFAAIPLALNASVPQSASSVGTPSNVPVEFAVAAEFVRPQTARRRVWLQRAVWSSIGAAACLVAVLGVYGLRNEVSSPAGAVGDNALGNHVVSEGASDLGLEWTNLSDQADALEILAYGDFPMLPGATAGGGPSAVATDNNTGGNDADDSDSADNSPEQLVAPGWLLAAVSPPGVQSAVSNSGTPQASSPRATE